MNKVLQAVIEDHRVKRPRSERQVYSIRLNEGTHCGAGFVEVNSNRQKGVGACRKTSVPASEVQNARIVTKVLQDFVQTSPSEETNLDHITTPDHPDLLLPATAGQPTWIENRRSPNEPD